MNFEQTSDNEWVCGEYRIVKTESGAYDCYWRDTPIGGGWTDWKGAVDTCKCKAIVLEGAA